MKSATDATPGAANQKKGNKKAKGTETAKRAKEVFFVEREIDVDGNKATLLVKIDFNRKNGNFTVSGKVTTKQVSHISPSTTKNTIEQHAEMIEAGVALAMQLQTEWTENPETNQLQIKF